MYIASIGIDLAKTIFYLIALGEHNKVLVRKTVASGSLVVSVCM